jgi:hypothetical protein
VTRTSPTITFTVKIDAKKLDITSKVATVYSIAGVTSGQELTYDNAIYTNDSMLSEVVTNIATVTNRPMVTIPMRDDPKLFVGDSVMLSGIFVDEQYRYTLAEAKRTFNGALRAEYTFV